MLADNWNPPERGRLSPRWLWFPAAIPLVPIMWCGWISTEHTGVIIAGFAYGFGLLLGWLIREAA